MTREPLDSKPETMLARSDERRSCEVAARLGAGATTSAQLEFAESQDVAATIIDYSRGGLGVRMDRFVPLGAEVVLKIVRPSGEEVLCRGRAKRVVMIDRAPTYYIGLSFEGEASSMLAVMGSIAGASTGVA